MFEYMIVLQCYSSSGRQNIKNQNVFRIVYKKKQWRVLFFLRKRPKIAKNHEVKLKALVLF